MNLQWATLIVDTYEKAAIKSLTREGALVQAYAPLTVIESTVSSTKKLLERKDKATGEAEGDCGEKMLRQQLVGREEQERREKGRSSDPLLQELGVSEEVLSDLSRCIDCDLRANFDWQIQPLQLINPLDKLLADIEKILDDFQKRLDASGLLGDLCDFEIMCLADLIRLLLMLQLLLKKYSMFSLKIQLDWTAVVGPLIKGIVDGMVSLLSEIYQIVVMPIDCILGALKSQRQLFATDILSSIPEFSLEGDVELSTKGFTYTLTDTLEEKLKDPLFDSSTTSDQIILAVQEARNWISDLYANLLLTFHSVNAFMTGSVSIQLKNSGMIMMILDLIAVLKLIIEMKQAYPDGNWCQGELTDVTSS